MNRRDFLKLCGITTAASFLDFPILSSTLNELRVERVRILRPLTVGGSQLLPDSVHPIQGIEAGWVRLSQGTVPETAVQPMLVPHGQSLDMLPAYVEVIAPYSALRTYAAADAPLLARPDHGAVLHASRQLEDQHGKIWLQASYGDFTGWVQQAQVQPVLLPNPQPEFEAVLSNKMLFLRNNGREIMQFPAAHPPYLPAGVHHIREKSLTWHSAPYPVWNLVTDRGLHLGGVTHHNDFLQAATSIELPFLAAKVMFGILNPGARLIII